VWPALLVVGGIALLTPALRRRPTEAVAVVVAADSAALDAAEEDLPPDPVSG